MVSSSWKKVFAAAVKKAKEIRAKNPNLKFPQAVKQAWKDPEIKKMKDEYDKNKEKSGSKSASKSSHKKKSTKKGGASKRKRTSKKKRTGKKKTGSRTTTRKTRRHKKK